MSSVPLGRRCRPSRRQDPSTSWMPAIACMTPRVMGRGSATTAAPTHQGFPPFAAPARQACGRPDTKRRSRRENGAENRRRRLYNRRPFSWTNDSHRKPMEIVVCIKRVPTTDTAIKIAADGRSIDTQGVQFELNAYDEFALEQALRIKEQLNAGSVTVVTLGPKEAQKELRDALARGADKAVLLVTDKW